MCGRLALTLPPDMVAQLFDAAIIAPDNAQPRYNVCPTQDIRVAISAEGSRQLIKVRWGFIPHWYKKPNDGPLLINARSETIAEKPAFQKAARERRCLIPATGFYEWTKAQDGGKDPWYIYPNSAEAFAFAGVWQDWAPPGSDPQSDDVIRTAAIVTCPAGPDLEAIHHRQPVMISPQNYGLWLGEEGKGAATLMTHASAGSCLSYRVDRAVNSSRAADEASLLEPFES